MDSLDGHWEARMQAGQEMDLLEAEYRLLVKQIDELYEERKLSLGDPGAYYDMSRDINAKEERCERIDMRMEQLKRIWEGV